MSIGAHAVTDSALEEAEDFGWHLARHFKLHLHPTTMKSKYDIVVEPLPPGIALEQIYKDFFGYLYNHTQKHFKDHEIGGEAIWNRLEGAGLITIVITHPNGWGAYEQAFLRKAVVSTGRVPQAEAQKRVKMLSEAEASAHFVMRSGATGDRLQVIVGIVLVLLLETDRRIPLCHHSQVSVSLCVTQGAPRSILLCTR